MKSAPGRALSKPAAQSSPRFRHRPPARPAISYASPEEKRVVESFASRFNAVASAVIARPDASYPPGGMAEKLQQAFRKLPASRRATATRAAQDLLAAPEDERRTYFGSFVNLGSAAEQMPAHAPVFLNTDAEDLKVTVSNSPALKELLANLGTSDFIAASGPSVMKIAESNTSLEIIEEAGKAFEKILQEVVFPDPKMMSFRWKTEDATAGHGTWELWKKGAPSALATGTASKAPGGFFKVDFRDYLPLDPVGVVDVYHFWVAPRVGPLPTMNPTLMAAESLGVAPDLAGPYSNAVKIVHVGEGEVTQFSFPKFYSQLDLYIDSLEMLVEQVGSGAEEFHLAGFVEEIHGGAFNPPWKIQSKFAKLDWDDGPRKKSFGHEYAANLSSPDQGAHTYIVAISLIEEDAGEEISDWVNALWEVANGAMQKELNDIIEELIAAAIQELGAAAGAGIVAELTASVAASVGASVAGFVVQAVTLIIGFIVADMADDYYGTEAFTLYIPSTYDQYVHATYPGSAKPGGYVLKKESEKYRGPPASIGAAVSWDGEAKVTLHWEFSKKKNYAGNPSDLVP